MTDDLQPFTLLIRQARSVHVSSGGVSITGDGWHLSVAGESLEISTEWGPTAKLTALQRVARALEVSGK